MRSLPDVSCCGGLPSGVVYVLGQYQRQSCSSTGNANLWTSALPPLSPPPISLIRVNVTPFEALKQGEGSLLRGSTAWASPSKADLYLKKCKKKTLTLCYENLSTIMLHFISFYFICFGIVTAFLQYGQNHITSTFNRLGLCHGLLP